MKRQEKQEMKVQRRAERKLAKRAEPEGIEAALDATPQAPREQE